MTERLNALTFELVARELRPLRVTIRQEPGNYVLTYTGDPWGPRRDTDDLRDALAIGLDMAENPPEATYTASGQLIRRKGGKGHRRPGKQPTAHPRGGRP